MNMVEFSNQIPSDQLIEIFKDFFEQHILAYDMLKGVEFVKVNNITINKSSIMYSVKLLNDEDKEKLVNQLNNLPLTIYDKTYTPSVFLNGDLLCITIDK